jgi:hypothetical protein
MSRAQLTMVKRNVEALECTLCAAAEKATV